MLEMESLFKSKREGRVITILKAISENSLGFNDIVRECNEKGVGSRNTVSRELKTLKKEEFIKPVWGDSGKAKMTITEKGLEYLEKMKVVGQLINIKFDVKSQETKIGILVGMGREKRVLSILFALSNQEQLQLAPYMEEQPDKTFGLGSIGHFLLIFFKIFLHALLNSKYRDNLEYIKQIIENDTPKEKEGLQYDLEQIHYGLLNFFLNLRAEGEQSLIRISLHDETAINLEYIPKEKRVEFDENLRKGLPWVTARNIPPDKRKEVGTLIEKFNRELREVLQISE